MLSNLITNLMTKPIWVILLLALSLLVVGAAFLRFSASIWPGQLWFSPVATAFGLLLVGIGQAILIFKLIDERAQASAAKAQMDYVEISVSEATKSITANITEYLGRTNSILEDCEREHIREVLPPRRKPKDESVGSSEKNEESFDRLWEHFVTTLSKDCADDKGNPIELRLCSIAETDIFHGGGVLTRRFSALLRDCKILLKEYDGKKMKKRMKWFCGCGKPESCKRKLRVQVIILSPESDAARVRTAAEGADKNELLEDINRSIGACKNLAHDLRNNPRVTLELSVVHHHPLSSFIHTPDWVQIEIIHWGRTAEKVKRGGYKCLGGRVPVLIFSKESPLHTFLKDQFDLQWEIPFSKEPGGIGDPEGIGWLGTERLITEAGAGAETGAGAEAGAEDTVVEET